MASSGQVNTTFSYEGTGLLQSVSNANATGQSDSFAYPVYDARRRLGRRTASAGVSWSNLQYDGYDQLFSGSLSTGRMTRYGYDGRGTGPAREQRWCRRPTGWIR